MGPAKDARFGSLQSLVATPSNNSFPYYTYDRENGELRALTGVGFGSWFVSKVCSYSGAANDMAFSADGSVMYLSSHIGVWMLGITVDKNEAVVVATKGDADSSASNTKTGALSSLVSLSDTVLVILDNDYRKLRVYDSVKRQVSSLCRSGTSSTTFREGDVNSCFIGQPDYLLKHPTEDLILICSDIDVRQMDYTDLALRESLARVI